MIQKLLIEAGKILCDDFFQLKESTEKSKFDLVTETDIKIEAFIVSQLKTNFPGYSIFSEECGSIAGDQNKRWILDPIDGTADFVFGVPYSSISLCLEVDSTIVEAYVYNPISNEFYYSTSADSKSYLNNSIISVSETSVLKDSLIAFGFSANYTNIMKYYSKWQFVFENCKKGMPLISPALTICNVARGRIDAFIDFGASMEGQAAASFILKNAGGKLYNYDLSAYNHKDKGIIALNKNLQLTGSV